MVGTVGYMSPEQVRGLPVDARTDVFSLGVVLYELLAGRHPYRRETAVGTLTAILEATPVDLVSLGRGVPPAVSGIVRRCLEKGREERYPSAHDVAVALEAVLQAPAGAALLQEVEERSPYPGLSSFTEKDAAHFFGREAEVKALWQRLQSRKLLAVIGPSGAGKSSFLRAGVIPARPEGWTTACATPGGNPALGLARALTPGMAGDAEAIGEMLAGVGEVIQRGESDRFVAAVKRWRGQHAEALLVVDQFEELFTLNAKETQERFAALLGGLPSEADVHVLLSLRDDFLMRCHEQPALVPVFTELTPLGALTADGLRRALVEPAKKLGYRFEDEALVAEMIESVEGARGALPLLAFAVARLWEKRDRERKLLTRAAYEEIGGVAGALAQHAEATMDRIGPERQTIVREIFRNLVTAQGTRAVAEREELLSAFPQRKDAEEVLRELIDARLADELRGGGAGGRAEPPPGGGGARVAAEGVAASRAVADAGRGGGGPAGPAQAGGAPVGGEGALAGRAVERDGLPGVRAVAGAVRRRAPHRTRGGLREGDGRAGGAAEAAAAGDRGRGRGGVPCRGGRDRCALGESENRGPPRRSEQARRPRAGPSWTATRPPPWPTAARAWRSRTRRRAGDSWSTPSGARPPRASCPSARRSSGARTSAPTAAGSPPSRSRATSCCSATTAALRASFQGLPPTGTPPRIRFTPDGEALLAQVARKRPVSTCTACRTAGRSAASSPSRPAATG